MLSSGKIFQETQSQLDHGRLLSLINSLSEGFLAVDEQGNIELSNSVSLALLDTNSLESKNITQAMPVYDSKGQPQKLMELARTGENYASRDLCLKYKDGSLVNLYVNISPVHSGFSTRGMSGYLIIFRDITQEKQVQDERDEFISVASHELRNPVAIAEGSISNALMLAEKTQTVDTITSLLKSAHEQVIFLGSLINDLSMVARADREKFLETAQEFDPMEVIKSLQSDFTAQAQKKGLTINIEAAQVPKITGSRLYTREILQNFITNALKYTQKGGIFIKAAPAGDGIDLSVVDTGIGIQPEEQKKLFSKFFRSDDSRVRQVNGTGLGLYVSAKLAKLMGGSIFMKSEYNKGSIFTLHLPANAAQRPAQANPVKPVA